MPQNMKIHSQPARQDDRWISSGVSEALAESRGMDPGCRPFQILPDTPNEVRFPLADGTEKVTTLGLPKRNLVLSYTQLDSDEARKLDWMMRNGKAIAVCANFDKHTQWMSHFGGLGVELKGVAEVGLCTNETVIRRDKDLADDEIDYAPDVQAGYNAMIGRKQDADGNWLPKIVPGMIGGAALFESGHRCNLATRRYSASAVTSSLQLWPNSSGGGHVAVNVTAAVPTPLAIGSDYIDNILILPDSNVTAVYPSDRYVESANQTGLAGLAVCISVLARGSGTMTLGWQEGGVENDYEDFDLSEEWQWFTLACQPAGTGRVRIHGGSAAARSGCHIQTRALQIEEGYGPSGSFMDYGAVAGTPVTDCIHIPEALNPGGSTLVFWVKYRNDDDDKYLFVYYPNSTSDQLILSVRGKDLVLEDMAASTEEATDCFDGIADGTWVQIVLTYGASATIATFNRRKMYVNGALVSDTPSSTRAASLAGADPHLYIGGDGGSTFAAATGGACMMAMDSARVDARVWSADEVLADYELRSDEAMQAFIQMVQGRYFKPAQSFRPQGPYHHILNGEMQLREVDIRRQTVP